ncbi:MAG: hypothetical protein ACTTIC_01225 [Helicobacteraceae bacterium]
MDIISAVSDNTLIETDDIKRELALFAKANSIEVGVLDFNLISHKTLLKTPAGKESAKEVAKEKLAFYENRPELILGESMEFFQRYFIEILSAKENPFFSLEYRIDYSRHGSCADLVVLPASVFNLDANKTEFYRLLYKEILKIKALNGILIDMFSDKTVADLKPFVIDLFKAGGLAREWRINLFTGLEPKESREAYLLEFYKQKEPAQEDGQKDDCLIVVEKDELIVEYKKPIFGKNGFSARGEILHFELSAPQEGLAFRADGETISSVEESDFVRFYAKVKGYVKLSGKILSIEKRYVVSDVKKTTNNNVTRDEINNIEVIVNEADLTKDGVGDGVELISERVKITGAVGTNAVLKAKEVSIEGMTHSKASIFAKQARINRHLGVVRASSVEIESLEGGVVYATTAKVRNVVSGVICAETVEIGLLKNHAKIYGAERITIERLEGEDNTIGIDVTKIETLKKKIHFYKEEIQEFKDRYNRLKKFEKYKDKALAIAAVIRKKQEELKSSLFSPYAAKITIGSKPSGVNTIYFFDYFKNTKIAYKTLQNQTPGEFYITEENGFVVMHPVNVKLKI